MLRPVLLALALLAVVPFASAEAAGFRTPSGKIQCLPGGGALRCTVMDMTNDPPPKPASCDLDYGSDFGLSRRGKARRLCYGDTIAGSYPVLAYGRTYRGGGITCRSRRTGLTCVNRSGHGFTLSRARQKLF